jgi:hypothetical protein
VRWQVSQSFELGAWFGDLPSTVAPLWQRKQPLVIPVCSKRADAQLDVMWQSSQRFELGT